jgi:gluconolactonase
MEDRKPRMAADLIGIAWEGIDHAEGLAIDDDGTVWCGGEEGQIYRGSLDEEPAQVAVLPGRTLGFALDGSGNAYCADMSPGLFRITPSGQVDLVSRGTDADPTRAPNHPAFLASGTLLFTDSGTWGEDDGCLYAVEPDGRTTVADRSACRFPNGLAVSPDGRSLAVVESTLPGVCELAVGADGSLSGGRVLVEMPETAPDGVAYDARGCLLISCWAPDAVFILDPDGELDLLVHDPFGFVLSKPTNVAFVPGTSRLLTANYGERFLSTLEHEAKGAPLVRPGFPWTPKRTATRPSLRPRGRRSPPTLHRRRTCCARSTRRR